MIARVTVRTNEGELLPCHLAGFGMTVCGNCNQVLKTITVGARCTGCGAAVVEVERVNSTFFEGEPL